MANAQLRVYNRAKSSSCCAGSMIADMAGETWPEVGAVPYDLL